MILETNRDKFSRINKQGGIQTWISSYKSKIKNINTWQLLTLWSSIVILLQIMRICAILGCRNGTYRLKKWKEKLCGEHGCRHDSCSPPFVLYPFPTIKNYPDRRKMWIKAVNRKHLTTGKNWVPSADDRVCSIHFVDGKPSNTFPYPSINLGYKVNGYFPKRSAPKVRRPPSKNSPPIKKARIEGPVEIEHNAFDGKNINDIPIETIIIDQEPDASNLSSFESFRHDHDYTYLHCESCERCVEKNKVICQQQTRIDNWCWKILHFIRNYQKRKK